MAEKKVPTYILVPRKLVITWGVIALVLFIGNLSSFQYTNWVDRHSNRQFCKIFTLSVEANRANPKPTSLQKAGLAELQRLQKQFCE